MITLESRAGRVTRVAALGLWLVLTLFPLYWIVVTAFKPTSDIYRFPLEYWPSTFSMEKRVSPPPLLSPRLTVTAEVELV